ncbi:MAG TPA: hypothetical protein DD433_06455 [Ruminococcaceae bacterium]|jgi:hypothetical protein|nr:hypothetical protein [Oscillospiraceae bacterium]
MLRKLLKYEFQATGRIFLPLYLLLFLFTVMNKAFLSMNSGNIGASGLQIPTFLAMTAYVCIVVAIVVVTLVATIQRFYKNLLTDEGYLMFTLPVSVHSHIFSKLLVASVWTLLSTIFSILSVFILAASPDFMNTLSRMIQSFLQAFGQFGAPMYLITGEAVVLVLVTLAASILNIYVSIALGHLVKKHRVAGALGAYFLIGLVEQFLFSIFMTAAKNGEWFRSFENWDHTVLIESGLAALILVTAALGAIYYFGTYYILKNKLNLE